MIENPLLTASTLAAGWLNDQRFDMKVIGREEHPTEVARFKVIRFVAPPDQLTSFEYRAEVVWLTAFELINEVRSLEKLLPLVYFDKESGACKIQSDDSLSLGGLVAHWILDKERRSKVPGSQELLPEAITHVVNSIRRRF